MKLSLPNVAVYEDTLGGHGDLQTVDTDRIGQAIPAPAESCLSKAAGNRLVILTSLRICCLRPDPAIIDEDGPISLAAHPSFIGIRS